MGGKERAVCAHSTGVNVGSLWLQLVPLLFSVCGSPEFEATVGRVRAGQPAEQLDQHSRYGLHLHGKRSLSVTLRYCVCSIHPEPSM